MLWLAAVLMLETPPSTPNDWLSDARREAALAVTGPRARLAPTTSMIPRSWGNVLFMTPQLRLRAAGNTIHVIVDQVVLIHDEEGLFIDGAPRAKDDSVAISPTILLRLKDLPPQKPTPEGE